MPAADWQENQGCHNEEAVPQLKAAHIVSDNQLETAYPNLAVPHYKLKLNQGDIKSVQGDSGHAQASMVTDQYSHILDENRQENAKLLEKAFYTGRGAEPEAEVRRKQVEVVDQMNAMGFDPLQLAKVLSNPDMVKMLQMLAGSGAAN